MDNLLDVVSARLKELFEGETETVTANKLLMSQGNLNKIKNGKQALTLDNLRLISEKYHVSTDWILGLKDDREVNALNMDALDYSQVFLLLAKLHENKTIEAAQPSETVRAYDFGDEDDDSDVEAPEEEHHIETEGADYDLLRINDPALSFILRRRMKLLEVDPVYFDDWKKNHLAEYKGLPLLICDESMRKFLLTNRTGDSDGDWSTTLAEYIRKINKKENGEDK